MPALFTAIRSGARRFAASTEASIQARSVTSPTDASARPPASVISATTDVAWSPSRSFTITAAPLSASRMAIARPMPLPAPVTIAERPETS